MPGLFDDIPSQPTSLGLFDDVPSWTNVQGGSAVPASFSNVQGGAAQAPPQSDMPIGEAPPDFGTTPQAEANALNTSGAMDNAANAVKEIPGALYTGLASGSSALGKYAGLAAGGAAGLFDDIAGTDTQGAVFRNVVKPYDEGESYYDKQLAEKGTAAQIAGGVTKGVPDLLLAAASGGETAALKAVPYAESAAQALARNIATSVAPAVKMSAPLATKAAADAYAQRMSTDGDWLGATTDALKAIGSTLAMAAAVPGEGPLLARVAQGGASAGAVSESLRSLEGRDFNPVELGTAIATGAGFGVAGHEAPRDARGEPIPREEGQLDLSQQELLAEKPRGRYNHETGRVEGLFDDLIPDTSKTAQEAPQGVPEAESTLRSAPPEETAPRPVQEPTEASQEPSVQELTESDLSPAERAAFERQTQRDGVTPNDEFQNNASGESSASVEAINRIKDEKALGQTRLLIDKDGSVRPLIGVDAVDTFAKDGQVIVQRNVGKDEWTVLHADPKMSKDLVEGKLNASKPALAETVKELASEQAPAQREAPKAPETTSIKNAVVDSERAAKGQDEIAYEGRRSDRQAWDTASERLKKDPEYGRTLAAEIAAKGRPPTGEEVAALHQDRMRIHNETNQTYSDLMKAMDGNATSETQARIRLKALDAQRDVNDRAAAASGTESSASLRMRRYMAKADYSMASVAAKAKAAFGKAIPEEMHARLSEATSKIEELTNRIDELEKSKIKSRAERVPMKQKMDAEKQFKTLSEKLKKIREHMNCAA